MGSGAARARTRTTSPRRRARPSRSSRGCGPCSAGASPCYACSWDPRGRLAGTGGRLQVRRLLGDARDVRLERRQAGRGLAGPGPEDLVLGERDERLGEAGDRARGDRLVAEAGVVADRLTVAVEVLYRAGQTDPAVEELRVDRVRRRVVAVLDDALAAREHVAARALGDRVEEAE